MEDVAGDVRAPTGTCTTRCGGKGMRQTINFPFMLDGWYTADVLLPYKNM